MEICFNILKFKINYNMLKGIKVISEDKDKQTDLVPEIAKESYIDMVTEEKVDENIKLLNKKRNIDVNREKQIIENFIFEKKKKEESFDFNLNFNNAIEYFFNSKNNEFKEIYEKLETYKRTKSNLKGIPENIMHPSETTVKTNNNIYEKANNYKRNQDKTDEEIFDEINNNKSNNYTTKENYMIDDDRETQEEIDNRYKSYISNNLKNELNNMKQFEDFERLIPRKQIEISKKDGETANENNILKIEAKLIKDEEISKKKRIKKRLVIMSNCEKCFGSQVYNFSVISQSENVYVSYPYLDGSLIDMHVILSTKEHSNSMASLEENVYIEMRNYQKSIVSMNAQNDKMTVFLEFSSHTDQVKHLSIDCIPLKFSLLDDLRIFFKKALMDQDVEWSSNKNIVDTTKYKGNLTKILSAKFSYVHVDFNAQGGFLHVIENEKRFSKTFLKEILSPFIKRDISEIKYPKKLSQKELIDNVEEYKNKFSYYDWTKYNN